MRLWNPKKERIMSMNQLMIVKFLENDMVEISFASKKILESKENIFTSLKTMIENNYVMGSIQKQNIGEIVYYQFYYFDGTISRSICISIPRTDTNSIQKIEPFIQSHHQR